MERLVLYLVVLGLLTAVYGIVQYRIGFAHLAALGPGFDFYNRFAWGTGVRATSSFVGNAPPRDGNGHPASPAYRAGVKRRSESQRFRQASPIRSLASRIKKGSPRLAR